MKIPLLQGAYADSSAAFHTSYPINQEPTLVDSGISQGYLTNSPGVRQVGTGPGPDRGSINWNDVEYRVMGSKLVRVDASWSITVLGDVDTDGLPVSMDYSFDRLAIASARKLFYYQPATGVTQVTDPNLGPALDVLWIDSYFMTTDGEALVVTELNDPYTVDPLKYGSSEADPDPVVALAKIRGEVYPLNRYTIQNLQDLSGQGFPFQNNASGLIPRGCVGTKAWAYFNETVVFVGSGRGEQLSVYAAGGGRTACISTSEIDKLLAQVSPERQALIQLEPRVEDGEQRLYVHLPDKTLVYMHQASVQHKEPVWHLLADGIRMDAAYSPRHMSLCYGKWIVGDSTGRLGYLDNTLETRWGEVTGWQFDTTLLYNGGRGGIIHTLELIGLPGRAPLGADPTCAFQWTLDGENWSQPRFISTGKQGQRRKRVQWRPNTRFSNYIGLRFRGASTAMASWAALEAEVEPLRV